VGTRDELRVSDEAAGDMLYAVRHFATECSGGADGHANRSAANTTATMMMMIIYIYIYASLLTMKGSKQIQNKRKT